MSRIRAWTVFADERFLRTQMAWFLPDRSRVRAGFHPNEWDGRPLVFNPGVATLEALEPLWRQISVLRDRAIDPELVAVRTVELFAQWMSVVIPVFLVPDVASRPGPLHPMASGRHLAYPPSVSHVGRAIKLLRERMAEPWTATALAEAVNISRTHLTRLFALQTGIAPMRYLSEIRLAEFTRLIEESDIPLADVAKTVGWADARVASKRFRHRYGVQPSRYRRDHQTVTTNDGVPRGEHAGESSPETRRMTSLSRQTHPTHLIGSTSQQPHA